MARGHTINVYINDENEKTLEKVDEVKPEGIPRVHIIFEALELWLEENGYEQ